MQAIHVESFLVCISICFLFVVGVLGITEPEYKISTLVGVHPYRDEVPIERALFVSPQGLFLVEGDDGTETLYVADQNNFRIRKIAMGMVTTIAGDGNIGFSDSEKYATKASFNDPTDVFVSGKDVFVVDKGNHVIRMISENGHLTRLVGIGEPGFAGDDDKKSPMLSSPSSVFVVDGEFGRKIYIADTGNNRVRLYFGGSIRSIAGGYNKGFNGDGQLAVNAILNEVL